MNCRTCAGPCALKGSNHEGDCEGYKPQTNLDRLRAMSAEELARWIWAVQSEIKHEDIFSTDGWFIWLNQEAEE